MVAWLKDKLTDRQNHILIIVKMNYIINIFMLAINFSKVNDRAKRGLSLRSCSAFRLSVWLSLNNGQTI